MIIRDFNFTDFKSADEIIRQIHINESKYWRKTLSFGFYHRTPENSRSDNPYNIKNIATQQEWSGKWYFGVNYRVRCQQNDKIDHYNSTYASLYSAGFVKKGWLVVPHYFASSADQGVDFFKILNIGTRLTSKEFSPKYITWMINRKIEIGEENFDPLCTQIVTQMPDLDIIIGEAKLLI